MTAMIRELLKQLFSKYATNLFPVKYAPGNVTKLLAKVESGEVQINPPVKTPENFRGGLKYYHDKCIGCGLCMKVCPTKALEMQPDKKVKYYLFRCCFCSECVDVCPVKALAMTDKFLLSAYDTSTGFVEVVKGKEESRLSSS